jgi:hypothetical protein
VNVVIGSASLPTAVEGHVLALTNPICQSVRPRPHQLERGHELAHRRQVCSSLLLAQGPRLNVQYCWPSSKARRDWNMSPQDVMRDAQQTFWKPRLLKNFDMRPRVHE